MRIGFFIAAIAIGALIILGVQYGTDWFADEPSDAPAAPATPADEPVVDAVAVPVEPMRAEPDEPAIVLPPLNDSDGFVLEQLASFGLPAAWLDHEDLVRRLAVVIDNAPRGELPRRQLGFLAPAGGFKVSKRGDAIFIDPASFARYDGYLDILEAVDPQTLADTIELLSPLIVEGLAELGNHQGLLDQINVAIDSVMGLQGLGPEVRLVQPEVLYQFADPALEALSPLQKQVLRLGPENLDRLQRYLLSFQEALRARSS